MEPIYELFLEAVHAALENRQVTWGAGVTPEQMYQITALAEQHHVLPLVFEAIYNCPAATNMDGVLFMQCKRSTVQSVMVQAMKTEEFLELNRHLRAHGVTPVVVKGLICRSLYPRPDYRTSGDEDVLCGEHQFKACHKAMIDFGMEASASTLDSYEVPYHKDDSALFIELHKTLFTTSSDIFSDCNRFFDGCFDRLIEVDVQGDPVATLNHTDHMLYLILHAFKHFLHAGFGVRQVCDMVLYANAFGSQIDWDYVQLKCRGLRADKFAAALFDIGEKYLGFDPEKACYPYSWSHLEADGYALLADLLYGGIYGSSDRSRVHSSNMTLNAVSADKKGKKSKGNLFKTVFPPAKKLEYRFPYLKRAPFLLPVAWTCRIFSYAKETITEPESAAADVIRTGSQRIELLRQYDIID
ncbi:MAG: nucleotidyltransferase family protein [Oscillospiraceae bacterium]|nr:nucleotidyltransferase family protein [Oscillospiraceae bacterium]